MLDDSTKLKVKDFFKDLKDKVKLVVFTDNSKIIKPDQECMHCEENVRLMQELSELSDKIKVEIHDIKSDQEISKLYGVDKIPATVITGEKIKGIRFFGIPAGHEFSTLLNTIKHVSTNDAELSDDTRTKLDGLNKPVHIQVFITLSCPYCAPAASLAHRLALYSDLISTDVINAQEFPDIAQKYNVYTVPKIVINENTQFEGAVPETGFVNKVLEATKQNE